MVSNAMVQVGYIQPTSHWTWFIHPSKGGLMSTPKVMTAEQMLGRMVDPTDPVASLRQEVELVGIEGILEEAVKWLRPGEVLAPDFEADVRLVVSMLDTPNATRD